MCGFRRPVARRTSRLGRGICCDVDPDEVSAAEPDDDEGIEQVETDSWNNEQVHGGNVRRVVTQEGSRPRSVLTGKVAGNKDGDFERDRLADTRRPGVLACAS